MLQNFFSSVSSFFCSEEIQLQINASRKVLDDAISKDKIIYGVNTGFGKLSQVKIPKDKIAQLQKNLILSLPYR